MARAAVDGDLPEVVALGHDPDDLVALGDEDRTHIQLDDPLDRFEDGRRRLDLEDVPALLAQDLGHARHGEGTLRHRAPSVTVVSLRAPNGYKKAMTRIVVVALALSLALASTAAGAGRQSGKLVTYVHDGGFAGKRDSLDRLPQRKS